jgi:hypothetical protein
MSTHLQLEGLPAAELLEMSNRYAALSGRAKMLGNLGVFGALASTLDTAMNTFSSAVDGTSFSTRDVIVAGAIAGSIALEVVSHHFERRWSHDSTDTWIAYAATP